VKPRFEHVYQRSTGLLPPKIAARVDLLRPSLVDVWGGALNGQQRRRELVAQIAASGRFDRVIETGTFRGASTEYLADAFAVPVETVENDRRLYAYSERRLRAAHRISVRFGDSRAFLRQLAESASPSETVFFYLDAHWNDDLPLAEELEIIGSGWARCVVMIDDFEVPGDAGYSFDDYGEGKALTAEYLPAVTLAGWSLSYPSAPAVSETGSRRGCCVLASPPCAALLGVPGLGPARVL